VAPGHSARGDAAGEPVAHGHVVVAAEG
jgi:hypothetical protein